MEETQELEKEYQRAWKSFLIFDKRFNKAKKLSTKEKYLRAMEANQKYRDLIMKRMGII